MAVGCMCADILLAAALWAPWALWRLPELEPAERNRRLAMVACAVQECRGGIDQDQCYEASTTKKRLKRPMQGL